MIRWIIWTQLLTCTSVEKTSEHVPMHHATIGFVILLSFNKSQTVYSSIPPTSPRRTSIFIFGSSYNVISFEFIKPTNSRYMFFIHEWMTYFEYSYLISEQMIYKCRARVAISTDCNPFINTVCMDGQNIIQLIAHSSRPKIDEG